MNELRTCKVCVLEKEVGEFPKNAYLYQHPMCKLCRNAYNRSRRKARPDIYKAAEARRSVKPGYKEKRAAHFKMQYADPEIKGKMQEDNRNRLRREYADPVSREKRREYAQRCRLKFRAKNLAYARQRQAGRQEFLNQLKNQPCKDCGHLFPPCCMDFDHVSGQKIANVSLMKSHSMEKFMLEISKCDLICANCHRIRTFSRNNNSNSAVESAA